MINYHQESQVGSRDQGSLAYCLCLPTTQAGLGSCAHHPHSTEVVALNPSFQKSVAGSGWLWASMHSVTLSPEV